MRRVLTAVLLSCCAAGPVGAQVVPTHPDLTYAVVGGRELQLDLYLPDGGAAPHPVLVWIHGGGWSGGTRFPAPPFALAMRSYGFAVASISYRLTSQATQWGGEPVVFPAQIHDTKAAIRWLRGNAATYQLDPARVAAWGASAGGHLAALAALSGNDPALEGAVGNHAGQSSAVQAAVDYYGPTDLFLMSADVTTPPGSNVDHDAPDSGISRLVGFDQPGQGMGVLRANLGNPAPPYPELVLRTLQASPLTWVDGEDPPVMIVHGTADRTVPFGQSERLRARLVDAGHAPVLLPVPAAGHGGFPQGVALQAHAFLRARLDAVLFADGFEPLAGGGTARP
jgi:acetyl esterase/lipase